MNKSRAFGSVAFAVALATGCSQLLNLDQFNGAILGQADASLDGAQSDVAPGDDVTQPDSNPTDVRIDEASDGAAQPDSTAVDGHADAGDGYALPDSDAGDAPGETGDGTTNDGGSTDSQVPADAADAANGDATPPGDAGDAGGGGEAGDWCLANMTANTALCRDFDDNYSYQYGFTSTVVNLYSGALPPTIVNNVSASPPNSLLFYLPLISCTGDGGSSTSSCSEQAQLNTSFSTKSLMQVAFALRVNSYDQNNVHDLSLVRISYNGGAWTTTWDLQLAASTIYETIATDGGAPVVYSHQGALPPFNEWVNVVFSVDINAETVSLIIGSNNPVRSTIYGPPISGTAVVTVGINNYIGPSTPVSVYLDNILISKN